jgi:glycosyltransferase involved in cell wall biosynthesis
MRIAFVSDVDPYDRAAFSGSTYQILQIVLATGASVEVVGPVMKKWRFQAVRLASIPARLTGRGVAWPKSPFLLRSCAQEVDAAVRRINPDVVFSPGSNAIAYSNFLKPTVFWSDAPFGAMMDYYPWAQFQRLTEASRRYGLEADTRALRYSAAGIFRSNWARDSAIKTHHADPDRVHVLPLPGNLFRRWTKPEVQQAVAERLKSPWKIFFSGVDWQRKGGDRAVAILNELVRLGQPCEFHTVGAIPPERATKAAQFPVHSLSRQSLNNPAARELMAKLLFDSTFLLVPTAAEALGLVFCEALSAGVPSIGTATGGVPDAISDGKTGLLIDPNEPPGVTAKRMLAMGQPEVYGAATEASWEKWHAQFAMEVILGQLTGILERARDSGPKA